jgi:hypothetical protein
MLSKVHLAAASTGSRGITQPRPISGMVVAITVMVATLASSGSEAM